MKQLCILGGSPDHRGGLESFCERALEAIARHGVSTSAMLLHARTAYPRASDVLAIAGNLFTLAAKRPKYDLIWLQVSNLGDLLYLPVLKMLGFKVLVTPHFGLNSRLQTIAWRRLFTRWVLNLSDHLVLLFDRQSEEIALPSGVRCDELGSFLPAGLLQRHENDQLPVRDDTSLQLLHAGRFSEAKGTLLAIEVLAELRSRRVPAVLRLVGRGDPPFMEVLREKVRQTELDDFVSIDPWLDEPDMQTALRKADVLVHLSCLDSFPLIVLEALAADTLPAILPMPGGMAMVNSFGGHVADPTQAARDVADWITRMSPSHLREKGRQAGRGARKTLQWSLLVTKLETIIRRSLGEPTSPVD